MRGELRTFGSTNQLMHAAAEEIVQRLSTAVRDRSTASFVLSGGSTPRALYELLASDAFAGRVEWENVHFFWGDERCVPASMTGSNFKMASEAMLSKLKIPPSNIHRIEGELPPPECAHRYDKTIRKHFNLTEGGFARFDLLLLGLGGDGHTASLFPGITVASSPGSSVAEVYVEKLGAHRITLTLSAINYARSIMFLVTGKGKTEITHNVLEGKRSEYPAGLVAPVSGDLLWFIDQEAASLLTGKTST